MAGEKALEICLLLLKVFKGTFFLFGYSILPYVFDHLVRPYGGAFEHQLWPGDRQLTNTRLKSFIAMQNVEGMLKFHIG